MLSSWWGLIKHTMKWNAGKGFPQGCGTAVWLALGNCLWESQQSEILGGKKQPFRGLYCTLGKTVRLGLLKNISTRKGCYLKHSPCSDTLQAKCRSGSRQVLGAEVLGVDERLKSCPKFECVVLSSLSSPSTCKVEKGRSVLPHKASRPSRITSSLILSLAHAEVEGEGNWE